MITRSSTAKLSFVFVHLHREWRSAKYSVDHAFQKALMRLCALLYDALALDGSSPTVSGMMDADEWLNVAGYSM